MCQLEGSDHGGRDSAAELALAGTIDVQAVERLLQPAGFGANPPFDGLNYTPRRKTVNGFFRDPPALRIFGEKNATDEAFGALDFPYSGGLDALGATKNYDTRRFDTIPRGFLYCKVLTRHGQVAQLVERGPEKAGVGGSIPSLATINPRQK